MSSPTDLLLALRAELEEQLHEADTELSDIRSARSDSTSDDEHDPEGSTLSTDWSRIAGLRSATLTGITDVDAALERVAVGTYGLCANCGRAIAPGRLEARPAAALCIDCAR